MSVAPKYIPHYTVADYAQWEGDWELCGGVRVSMSPGPFGRHQELLLDLVVILREALLEAECNAKIVTELDWIVSTDTVLRPDALIVCGGIPDRYLETPPSLVIEVLSASTRERDRTYKRDLYESQGVVAFLIADPDARSLEILLLGDTGKYQPVTHIELVELKLCEDCEIVVDFGSLF